MSAPWSVLALGDGILAEAEKRRIEAAFASAFAGAAPTGAGVFVRTDAGRGLHCEVVAFFSPGARRIADALGAKPCAAPGRPGLERLCGAPD